MTDREQLLATLDGALRTYVDWPVAMVIAQAAGAHRLEEFSDDDFARRFGQFGRSQRPPRRAIRAFGVSRTFVARIDEAWPADMPFGAFVAAVRDGVGETMIGRLNDEQFSTALAVFRSNEEATR